MPRPRTRRVVLQPITYRAMQWGIDQVVGAIRPTLGPHPRIVAIDRILDERMPEMLDNGGTIAKRIIQLADKDADVGAMLIRDVLWRLQDQVGDGTATAAVLFQTIFNEGVRYLAAGGNAMRLQASLKQGMRVILDQLTEMSILLTGKEKLAQIAESICYDPPLAKMMGEIFDIIGEYGRLEIRPGRSRELEREYVEGIYWERGLVSRELAIDRSQLKSEFENGAILISDLDIESPQRLLPPLELAITSGQRSLLIVGTKFSDATIGFLLSNRQPDKFQVAAVKTPGYGKEQQAAALQDLAVLTGGRSFIKAAGDTFKGIKVEDFGRARRVWADLRNFGIVGGKGDPRALRQHIATLRRTYEASDDTILRGELLKRIGKLLGGSATLWVGGATELEIEARQELAKRTAAAMRGAIGEGVVPGGGVALLSCRPALQRRLEQSTDADERAAYHILIQAVTEPIRAIASNAGHDASDVLAEIRLAGPGHGFDVLEGQVVDMAEAGIYDATAVQKAAVYTAISSAAQALTIDVLIHRTEQPEHASIRPPSKRKKL